MPYQPDDITDRIIAGDEAAFEAFFSENYARLVNLAVGIVRDSALAEEQVQEVFIRIWEKRDDLKKDIRLLPYVMTSVRNRCYNYLRDQQVTQKRIDQIRLDQRAEILNFEYEEEDEDLIEKLHDAIDQLPDKCQEVFRLSRFGHHSHKEISEKLSISAKTVERHITRALKSLRDQLGGNLRFLLLLLGDLW